MLTSKSTKDLPNVKLLKAVASPVRMTILDYLKQPARHFPPQTDGDFVDDGVCADYIRDKLKIPVKFIGLGETPQDIETFDPQRFVDALFGEQQKVEA